MRPALVLLSALVATLRSSFGSLLGFLFLAKAQRRNDANFTPLRSLRPLRETYAVSRLKPLIALFTFFLFFSSITRAQPDSTNTNTDTSKRRLFNSKAFLNDPNYYKLTPQQKKKRIWLIAGANVIGYSSVMVGLYSAWYKDYPRTSFHVFNDWPEWKQMDKAGHMYSAYIESLGSMEMWRWTGISRKKRIWLGGMSGAVYQTTIEILDGFSSGWGWSWADFGANILGSGTLVAQELAWDEQRIRLKFSFHNKSYSDPELEKRSDQLFGRNTTQRFIKDYNGQTYWASINLRSFLPASNLPPWLMLSVGYGAEGLFGGTRNFAKDEAGNITFNRPDIKRYRQWYLAPDIDFSKIKIKSKVFKFFVPLLNAFKFPAPALEFSNGKLKAHAIVF